MINHRTVSSSSVVLVLENGSRSSTRDEDDDEDEMGHSFPYTLLERVWKIIGEQRHRVGVQALACFQRPDILKAALQPHFRTSS